MCLVHGRRIVLLQQAVQTLDDHPWPQVARAAMRMQANWLAHKIGSTGRPVDRSSVVRTIGGPSEWVCAALLIGVPVDRRSRPWVALRLAATRTCVDEVVDGSVRIGR